MLIPITSRDVSRVMGPHRHRELGPAAVRRTGQARSGGWTARLPRGLSLASLAVLAFSDVLRLWPAHTSDWFPSNDAWEAALGKGQEIVASEALEDLRLRHPDRARTIERKPSLETRGRTAPRLG